MTRVLLTGGSGFIAAHVLDILLEHGHSVVTTVRSQEKANKIKEAHPNVSEKQLSFAIVEDIAQEGAFDKAVVSDPPFEAVIHTASPFHFNVTDVQKVSRIFFFPWSTLSWVHRHVLPSRAMCKIVTILSIC